MTSLQNDPQGPPLTRRELRERERAAAQTGNVEANGGAEVGKGQAGDAAEFGAPAEPVSTTEPEAQVADEPVADEPAADEPAAEPAAPSFDNVLASDPEPAAPLAEQAAPSFAPPSFAPPTPAPTPSPAPTPTADARPVAEPGRPLTRRELRAQQHGEGAESGDTQVIEPAVLPGSGSSASAAPEAVMPVPVAAGAATTVSDAPLPSAAEQEAPRTFQPPTGHWSIAADEPEVDDPNATLATRSVVSTGSVTTANALILPSVPSLADATGPLTATGEILVTGSIDLPRSLGSTGQHPQAGFDSADIDHMFEQAAAENASTDATPIRAANAVSTHTSSRNVITPPKNRGTRLPTILAITAAVLALGVVGLLVAGYVFKVF